VIGCAHFLGSGELEESRVIQMIHIGQTLDLQMKGRHWLANHNALRQIAVKIYESEERE